VSHFEAVGFAVAEQAEAEELISTAVERTDDIVERADGTSVMYHDPSGARLTVHLSPGGVVECVQPGFEGRFRGRWRPLGIARDPDCRFCDLVYAELLEDGEMVYPFGLTVETMGSERALIPYGEEGEVRFAGLWEEGQVWPDEDSFRSEQEAEWGDVEVPEELRDTIPAFRGWASRSLIPAGTFPFAEGGTMTSHVLAYGVVTSVEERHNDLGGGDFRYVCLETLGGVFDTCLAPGTAGREGLLGPGAVARATLWLVGRPLTLREEPAAVPGIERPERAGRLRRLFRR
jgi:hypothetical protein